MAQSNLANPDRPYDPNDPSTWTDPSGNPLVVNNDPRYRNDTDTTTPPTTPGLAHLSGPNTGTTGTTPNTPQVGGAGGDYTDTNTDPTKENPNYVLGSPEDLAWKAAHQPQTTPNAPTPTPSYTPAPVTPDPATQQYNQGLRSFMLGQLKTLSGPTDATSPEVAPAIGAYNTQSQRDQQAERDAVAERFYAMGANGGEGLQSGGFNTAVQQGAEAAGLNRANFTGSMVWQASQAKRQQLQTMLQTAVGAGETDAAQQIQAQIANLDANLRAQGLSQQNAQFGDQLGFQYANLNAGLNRDELMWALTHGGQL